MSTTINGTTGFSTAGSPINTNCFLYRNQIINGNFDIWQRGTSHSTTGYGSADRWYNSIVGSSNTISQQAFTLGQTAVPNNPKYFLRNTVTSVTGSNNYAVMLQKIEDVTITSGKTVTLSFWAKADTSRNIATEFVQNFGTGGAPSAAVASIGVTTHALTTSWQKFTATTSLPSISGKTVGTAGDDFLQLEFWFDGGTGKNAFNNNLGQQSGTFDIAQVQLEDGSVASNFEQRHIGTELKLCQRYYQVNDYSYGMQVTSASTAIFSTVYRPVTMRGATPTGAIFSETSTLCTSSITTQAYTAAVITHTSTAAGYCGSFLSLTSDAEL